jgi:Cdc6-like AAA superfamily ATPase
MTSGINNTNPVNPVNTVNPLNPVNQANPLNIFNPIIKKPRVKRCFKDFISIMDARCNYYIMFSPSKNINDDSNDKNDKNDNNKENINIPKNTRDSTCKKYVSKNADDVPLPLPRSNPECIYHSSLETGDTGDAGENTKFNSKTNNETKDSENKVEVVKVDIDGKNACYDVNCLKCGNRIPFKINKVDIDVEVKNIGDLIKLCNDYKLAENIEYNINMKALHKIKNDLIELNNMIGMKYLKENIVDQLLYYLQNLHLPVFYDNKSVKSGDFLHTVIYGSPGTGKTEVAKIIGRIYSNIGVIKSKNSASSSSSSSASSSPRTLSSIISEKKKASSSLSPSRPKFKKVTRADLIAGYLGQTALKTKDVIKDSLGGVLFIDEAYALGNTEKRDSFAKECIDTLCEALSDNKDNLMVIIAGYEKDLKECFFSYNDGLDSRFTWRFKIDDYTSEDLRDIFIKKVNDFGWSISEEIKVDWFEKNMKYFKFYGRDMETLFSKTKIAHSRRVFCKPENTKTKITMKDLESGFELFIRNDEVKQRANDDGIKVVQHMYL